MDEVETTTIAVLTAALAACRRELEATRDELARERRERGQWMSRMREEQQQQIHHVYRAELADLKAKLAAEKEAHHADAEVLKAQSAARQQAYAAKVRDLASQLALYNDSGPARSGSDKLDGSWLDRKKPCKGHHHHSGGRKIPRQLPAVTLVHPLPMTRCPDCGEPLRQVKPAVSHEVEFEVRVVLTRRQRQKCLASCRCGWRGSAPATESATAPSPDHAEPTPFLLAPLPLKAMARTLFSDRSWVEFAILKYRQQIPVNQICTMLRDAGCPASRGTLCDGLVRLAEDILAPLDQAIIEHNLESHYWAADDTSLRLIEPESTRTHGVVWQIRSPDTTVYSFSRTGEAAHIQNYFAENPGDTGTLLADRAQSFQTLWFTIAFCWAHVRRDFVKLGRYVPGHRTFAIHWLALIRKLYRLHRDRRGDPDNPDCHERLTAHLERIATERDAELARDDLPEPRRKVLQSLRRHWHGLSRFLENPEIPLDNNDVERNFRPLARFRHNCQGCRSENGAHTAMRYFTIIATLEQNHVPLKPYLLAWCETVAANHGSPPPDLTPWLPWALDDDVIQRLERFRHG